MRLARFPRLSFAHLPTALAPLPRLCAELGRPEIQIKRHDCAGLPTGGNKTRTLEFPMAEGADLAMTQGAAQFNHAHETPSFAARLGMDCRIQPDPVYAGNGAAGLIGLIQQERFCSSEPVVFVRTGGPAALLRATAAFAAPEAAAA